MPGYSIAMYDDGIIWRWAAGGFLFVLAIVGSVAAGSPAGGEMPDIALGWAFLLHLERAAAVVGIIGLVVLVLWRAGRGEFPVRLGQIEYELRGTAEEMNLAIDLLRSRITSLEKRTRTSGGGVADSGGGG